MKKFHILMFALLVTASAAACQRPATPPPVDAATPAAPGKPETKRLDGAVRFNDAWLKVAPMVSHQAQMDIATGCLNRREDEIAAGKTDPVLCYDRLKRDQPVIRTIRLETGFGAMRDATAMMRKENESAHFVIERGGSIYQTLDIVYPIRRAGEYRQDEIRVIATGPDGAKQALALTDELKRHFPGTTVTSMEVK